jgi:poly(hydroxyalkanoate) depolymerase family esterase
LRRLSETIAHLATLRATTKAGAKEPAGAPRLQALTGFGANPGNLSAHIFVPEEMPKGSALVVVLHGCTQNASRYDSGSGWSELAARHGFALLYPEQQAANNSSLCFNWFEPGDIARDGGEVQSILQMVEHVAARHAIDRKRIFVTGLSAGGAMAATMLAAAPEIFAGGAVIAGLPHGVAAGVPQALERMRGQGLPASAALSEFARTTSNHQGPWPRLQVWHGTADAVVVPANGEALIGQWRPLHGLPAAPSRQEAIGPHLRRVWLDEAGRPALEHYAIRGLGHGLPLDSTGPDGLGRPGPHMLEAGISSTRRIAESWGLVEGAPWAAANDSRPAGPAPGRQPEPTARVGQVIESALKAAGLMR